MHSQSKYFRNTIDFNRKDRAKRYHKSSIFNRQYSIPAGPGWALTILMKEGVQNENFSRF
jgi:hypothetical protein